MTPHEALERLDHVLLSDPAPFTAAEVRALLAHMSDEDTQLLRVLNERCHWAELTHPGVAVERVFVPGCGPALNGDDRCDCDSLLARLAVAQRRARRRERAS